MQESPKILALLLGKGGDPGAGGDEGRLILWNAARFGRKEALRMLLSAGANPNAKGGPGLAGHAAAARGDAEMLRDLAEFGWDPRERDREGRLPRELAEKAGKGGVAEELRRLEEARGLAEASEEALAKGVRRGL